LTRNKLKIVQDGNGDVAVVEKKLDEGLIEQALDVAKDELGLVSKMIEWKAWESLEEEPAPGQWEYFGKTTSGTSS